MNSYNKIYNLLLEYTPSKKEIAQGKYGSHRPKGWAGKPIRSEDDPNISKGARRIRIMRRKKQLGTPRPLTGRGHSLRKLKALKKSPVISTGTEVGHLERRIKTKEIELTDPKTIAAKARRRADKK